MFDRKSVEYHNGNCAVRNKQNKKMTHKILFYPKNDEKSNDKRFNTYFFERFKNTTKKLLLRSLNLLLKKSFWNKRQFNLNCSSILRVVASKVLERMNVQSGNKWLNTSTVS